MTRTFGRELGIALRITLAIAVLGGILLHLA
jgi:hypothetical protein